MNPLRTLLLVGIALCSGCRPGSEEVSNQFELDAQSRADLLAADVAQYERDCLDQTPRSDGCLGLAQTLALMGRELETAGRTDTAIAAMRRAISLWDRMDLDEQIDSTQAKDYVGICLKLAQTLGVQDPQASSLLETARVKSQSLLESHPKDSAIAQLTISVWGELGNLHARAKSNDLALEFHRRSAELLDSLAKSHPVDSLLNSRRFAAWELAYKDLEAIGSMEASVEVARKALDAVRTARALDKSDPPNPDWKEKELSALNWVTLAHASASTWNLAEKEQREAVELATEYFSANRGDQRRLMMLSDARMRSADFDCRLNRKAQGEAMYLATLGLVDSFPDNSWPALTKSRIYADLVGCVDRPEARMEYARQAVGAIQAQMGGSTGEELENAWGNLAWQALLNRDFVTADSAARRGLDLAGERDARRQAQWMQVNQAHALLFQGKTSEAMTIYRDLAPREYPLDGSKTYAWFIEDDFKQLEKAGIRHADFAKVRAILKKR